MFITEYTEERSSFSGLMDTLNNRHFCRVCKDVVGKGVDYCVECKYYAYEDEQDYYGDED